MFLQKLNCLLASLCLCFYVHGQTIAVSGVVLDQETQESLPGVSISLLGSTNGTLTNISGAFEMLLSKNDSLRFSYVGYEDQVYVYAGEPSLKIFLKAGLELEEVVVTALGLKRETKALGYAIESLDSKEIDQVKAVNFLDNLGAKFSGVQVNQGATGVGSSSQIIIRGASSFTNNNPLFVVDGVVLDNSTNFNVTNEAAAGFQEVDFGNGAMDVNPDDVASVSVLKGPAAAALYGTRASNGVVIIETKSATTKDAVEVQINSSLFIDRAFRLPQFQNKYGQGNSGEFEYVDGLGGGINDNITYSYGPELDAGINIPQFDSPVTLVDGSDVRGGDTQVHGGATIEASPFISRPNNVRDFYETGVTASDNIALAGGFEKGNYRLSFTRLNSESIIPGVDFNRKNVHAKLNFKLNEKWSVSSSINYVNSSSANRPGSAYGSENVNYALVAWLGRQTNVAAMEDYWQPGLEQVQQFSYNYTFFDNPYFTLFENRNSFGKDRLYGMLAADYQWSDKVSVKIRSGMDYFNEQRNFRRAYSSNRFRNGAYAEHDLFFREINADVLLNYRDRKGHVTWDLSLGGNRMHQAANNQQFQTLSLAQPGVYNFSNAAVPLEAFSFISNKKINSLYALLKLSYKDFMYVDVTARNDWSSALASASGAGNVSFFYPSVSSSFLLNKLIDLPRVFSFAKLRTSWAQVGNDTAPYQTSNVFESQTPFGGLPTFSNQNFIANENLKPELSSAIELGADLRFAEDRLRFDFTYYNSLTENQILSLPIAQSTGYEQQVINGGAVRSKGVEILMDFLPVRKKNFKWNSRFNLSHNKTRVETLPEGAEQITLGYNRVYDNVNQTAWFLVSEGSEVGDIWGTGYLKNEAGDFIIGDDGKFIVDNSLKLLGNANPDFILGWNNSFQFKAWTLAFGFDWRQGGEIVSRTQALAGVAGQLIETENRPEEGIVAEGVVNVGTIEAPIYEANAQAISAETYYRQFYDRNHEENNTLNASYLKLREFRLSYQIPTNTRWFSWTKSASVSFVARNVWAYSAIKHFDPEQLAVQGTGFVRGVEDMSYATTRSLGLSFSLQF